MLQSASNDESNRAKTITRISMSLPEDLLAKFDVMLAERGFENRSQALCEMITQQLTEYRGELGNDIMMGTINLVYDHSVAGLQKKLHDLLYRYVDEVISTLNVNLTHTNIMSVILVQGPANMLKDIANQLTTMRGVVSARLLLSSIIIPPIHPLPRKD